MYALFAGFSIAGVLAALALWAMLRTGWPRSMVDLPNPRSLHNRPIPRIGGLALHPAWFVAWLSSMALFERLPVAGASTLVALSACMALFLVSLIDDRRRLPVRTRLLVQFACALAVAGVTVPGSGGAETVLLSAVVVLAMVWGTNLYNFMDGANGLAGGMALIGFSCYAWIAVTAGHVPIALVCASIAGAAFGFLRFNIGEARVFLGDCGSIPLGFLAGALGWIGFVSGTWRWWTPAVVFLPFIADATLTLIRRASRGERIWLAHREHAYQKLVLAGWSHARLARWAYAAMLVCGVLAIALQRQSVPVQHSAVVVLVAASLLILTGIERTLGARTSTVSTRP